VHKIKSTITFWHRFSLTERGNAGRETGRVFRIGVLDKDRLKMLIDKVIGYGADAIEIV
jgi:hypothetical protein